MICNPLMSSNAEHLFVCLWPSESLLWGGVWLFCPLLIFLPLSFRVARLCWIAVLYQLCLLQISCPCLWLVFSAVSGTEQKSPVLRSPAYQIFLSWTVSSVLCLNVIATPRSARSFSCFTFWELYSVVSFLDEFCKGDEVFI